MADSIVASQRDRALSERERNRRAGVIFGDLAALASCVHRLNVLLVSAGDEDSRDIEAYQAAIRALSAQMGLIADMGATMCNGLDLHGADPAQWLLSPIYLPMESSHG